jgi:hypothetical protein
MESGLHPLARLALRRILPGRFATSDNAERERRAALERIALIAFLRRHASMCARAPVFEHTIVNGAPVTCPAFGGWQGYVSIFRSVGRLHSSPVMDGPSVAVLEFAVRREPWDTRQMSRDPDWSAPLSWPGVR